MDVGSNKSVMCSLYISRNEHLHTNLNCSCSLRFSSCTIPPGWILQNSRKQRRARYREHIRRTIKSAWGSTITLNTYLLDPSKQVFKNARSHPTLEAWSNCQVVNVTEHCVRLSTPCLAISKHTAVVSSHAIFHHWCTSNSKEVFLQVK